MNTIDCVGLNGVIKVLYCVFRERFKICGSFGLVTAPPQQKLTDKTEKQNDKYDRDYSKL